MASVTENITEIGRTINGHFYVKPAMADYAYIWRAARGIRWDENIRALYAPADWVSSPAKIF